MQSRYINSNVILEYRMGGGKTLLVLLCSALLLARFPPAAIADWPLLAATFITLHPRRIPIL